jgi:tRNA G18 (ribose-2'-O)-methylase SpoU
MNSPNIIVIEYENDPRLDPYRNIKDRDLAGRGRFFMGEGKVVLERMFGSKLVRTHSVLTTHTRLLGLDISALQGDVPILVVAQSLMDKVAGFAIHRGYLALGEYVAAADLAENMLGRERVRILALSNIANTDNMGGLMRNAAAFGVDAVVMDRGCCDPLYRKAISVSVGGVFSVPHFRVDDLMATFAALHLTPYALSPSGEVTLEALVPTDRAAFIFGAEGPGLRADIMAQCQTVRIAMSGGFDSLNVATTSGIVLHQVCRP